MSYLVLDQNMRVEIDTEAQEARATVNLRRSGNATVLTIPKQILEATDFETGQEVEIVVDLSSGTIFIRESLNAQRPADD